jgi:hypothetical protein
MSTNFAVRLQQQMHGSAFDYLNQQLGIDLVSFIPTVDLSNLEGGTEAYPVPWTQPDKLPADIVKGVLPNGRPLVAMRYVHRVKDKESLLLEIFFQRHKFDASREKLSAEVIAPTASNWVAKYFSGDCIHNTSKPSATFQMIKALANGESLDKTDGRYLPMYADLYAMKV